MTSFCIEYGNKDSDVQNDVACYACEDQYLLKRQEYATTPALQYKYTCELLLLDYTDYEISGCKWGFIDEDNSGNMIAYCSACMEGYTPGEFASFSAVPMERLFKTCSKESTNPWGENCAYTGILFFLMIFRYDCSKRLQVLWMLTRLRYE